MDLTKFLPTPEMQAEFEKFKTLQTPEEVETFKKERKQRYDSLPEEEKKSYRASAKAGMDSTIEACNKFITYADEAILRDKLGELPDAISFSYIAKKYFGKSKNWLYQRINGYNVNGKPARFTKEEYDTFIMALKDISRMINQTSFNLT